MVERLREIRESFFNLTRPVREGSFDYLIDLFMIETINTFEAIQKENEIDLDNIKVGDTDD